MAEFVGTAPFNDIFNVTALVDSYVSCIQIPASLLDVSPGTVTYTFELFSNAVPPDTSGIVGSYSQVAGTTQTFLFLNGMKISAGASILTFSVTAGSPTTVPVGFLPIFNVFAHQTPGLMIAPPTNLGNQINIVGTLTGSQLRLTLLAIESDSGAGVDLDLTLAGAVDLTAPFTLPIGGVVLSAANPSALIAATSTIACGDFTGSTFYSKPSGQAYDIVLLVQQVA